MKIGRIFSAIFAQEPSEEDEEGDEASRTSDWEILSSVKSLVDKEVINLCCEEKGNQLSLSDINISFDDKDVNVLNIIIPPELIGKIKKIVKENNITAKIKTY
jgi:hypothetical protein